MTAHTEPVEVTFDRPLRRFNTGRRYREDGQWIRWTVATLADGRRVVMFVDESRFIDGVIDLHLGNLDLVDDQWVLRAYDDHHYYSNFRHAEAFRLAWLAQHPREMSRG